MQRFKAMSMSAASAADREYTNLQGLDRVGCEGRSSADQHLAKFQDRGQVGCPSSLQQQKTPTFEAMMESATSAASPDSAKFKGCDQSWLLAQLRKCALLHATSVHCTICALIDPKWTGNTNFKLHFCLHKKPCNIMHCFRPSGLCLMTQRLIVLLCSCL